MRLHLLSAIGAVLGFQGSVTYGQASHEVLVRDPTVGKYGQAEAASIHAKRQWVYAAMSDFAYEAAIDNSYQDRGKARTTESAEIQVNSCGGKKPPAIPPEWARWPDFPSKDLTDAMRKKGLFLLVLERDTTPKEIVVVFEGTNFTELPDWNANFRWFLRFIPGEDQYTMTSRQVSEEFFNYVRSQPDRYSVSESDPFLRDAQNEPIRIVSTGHSLGGGLAQHFAYTFKQAQPGQSGPKVTEVYAFDPSPVTGWFSSPNPPRTHNAAGLTIHRIFEHGEVLAYVRLLTSRLATSEQNPAIWEYRYNFDPKSNIVRNHSMRSLACGLALAADE